MGILLLAHINGENRNLLESGQFPAEGDPPCRPKCLLPTGRVVDARLLTQNSPPSLSPFPPSMLGYTLACNPVLTPAVATSGPDDDRTKMALKDPPLRQPHSPAQTSCKTFGSPPSYGRIEEPVVLCH